MYDLIGDIHGHAAELKDLLEILGYRRQGNEAYRHPDRQAVFLGDFIDRGPDIRGVVDTVRAMVEAGNAQAVMGNHEFNALCYHAEHPERPGQHLREHSEKNTKQHQATLDQFGDAPDAHFETLQWYETLPVWLDLGGMRVVHACWDAHSMDTLRKAGAVDAGNRLNRKALHPAATKGSPLYHATEILLKGMEVTLPDGESYFDKEGTERTEIRITWWDAKSKSSWRELAMGPKELRDRLPADRGPLPPIDIEYPASAPPVFVGHYWMSGTPEPLAPNVACVDYSVAKPEGALVAYRWQGEKILTRKHFVSVPRRAGRK